MPIYDFRCRECGRVVEIFLHHNIDEAVSCPHCGSKDMERLISASYIVKMDSHHPGTTCCGRSERCETPPCSRGEVCRRG